MNYASIGNKIASKFIPAAAQAVRMAQQRLGQVATNPAVMEGAKRIGRDTVMLVGAEQIVPRMFGGEAPDIRESLLRQGAGNIIAEGVTGGLNAAFPGKVELKALHTSGPDHKVFFHPEKVGGIKPTVSRTVGELTGQFTGQAIADAVLPGKQEYPFVNPSEQVNNLQPVSATGAVIVPTEPESAQVERRTTEDLMQQKLLNAQIEQQRYENKIQLAKEQNQPSIVMHEKRGDARAIALDALRQSSKVSY